MRLLVRTRTKCKIRPSNETQISTYVDIFQRFSHFFALGISMAVTLLNNDENAVLARVPCFERTLVAKALYIVTRRSESDSLSSNAAYTVIISSGLVHSAGELLHTP